MINNLTIEKFQIPSVVVSISISNCSIRCAKRQGVTWRGHQSVADTFTPMDNIEVPDSPDTGLLMNQLKPTVQTSYMDQKGKIILCCINSSQTLFIYPADLKATTVKEINV